MVGRRLPMICRLVWGLLVLVGFSQAALAQEPAATLAELTVDIWPDFDRPEVLVLLTGRVDPSETLPAMVTLPLPPEATLNAVARITSDNLMIDDIEFTPQDDSVSLVTPDARFRVEFYMPYDQNGAERSFSYRWLAEDLAVTQLAATVQQPAAAESMTVTPEAETISIGDDGLTYFNLSPVAVPAGEPFTVDVVYSADSDVLTASVLPVNELPAATVETLDEPSSAPAGVGTSDLNWPLMLAGAAGVLVVLVVGWQVAKNRQNRQARPATQRKQRSSTKTLAKPAKALSAEAVDTGRVNFCHQCGERARPGDKFCRNCGTALKVSNK